MSKGFSSGRGGKGSSSSTTTKKKPAPKASMKASSSTQSSGKGASSSGRLSSGKDYKPEPLPKFAKKQEDVKKISSKKDTAVTRAELADRLEKYADDPVMVQIIAKLLRDLKDPKSKDGRGLTKREDEL